MRFLAAMLLCFTATAIAGCHGGAESADRGAREGTAATPLAAPEVDGRGACRPVSARTGLPDEPLVPPLVLDDGPAEPQDGAPAGNSVGWALPTDSPARRLLPTESVQRSWWAMPNLLKQPGFNGRPQEHESLASAFDFDFSSDQRAVFHPHGKQVCSSGCAASNHPTDKLTRARFQSLLRRFADEPPDASSRALETLLFFGRQSLAMLESCGKGPLNEQRAGILRDELARTHALISFRVVDEHGEVRCWMPPTRVPLDRRHVFTMEVKNLPPLVTSGTVKRVGLHHLWTRI